MIIEIEGTDLAGKTTIIEELSKSFDIPKFKVEQNPFSVLESKFSWVAAGVVFGIAELCAKLNISIICDRFMMSDIIYSKVVPGRLVAIDNQRLHKFYEMYDTLTFVMIQTDEVLEERFEKRGDDVFSLKLIKRANDAFKEYYDKLNAAFPGRFFTNFKEFKDKVSEKL